MTSTNNQNPFVTLRAYFGKHADATLAFMFLSAICIRLITNCQCNRTNQFETEIQQFFKVLFYCNIHHAVLKQCSFGNHVDVSYNNKARFSLQIALL